MEALGGKSVVVTGAGRGLGAAYARLAAAEGATVVVNDVDEDAASAVAAEIAESDAEALVHVADVSDWDQAHGLVERCVSATGRIDGLVNNAGLFEMSLPGELEFAQLERILSVNVVGVAACGTHAIRHMVAQGSGSIVNAVSGAHFGIPNMAAYAASKGAVASLTYTWALELQGTGVRVNAISPLGRTRMGETVAAFLEAHGLGTIAHQSSPAPEVSAPVAVFLLSDRASALTGQIVRIEGAQLALVAHPVVLEPILERDEWTIEAVADAFATVFRDRLVPVGMTPLLRAEYLTGGSKLWGGRTEAPAGP